MAVKTSLSSSNSNLNGSVLFDGSGDYLQLAFNNNWSFGTGDLTIECWVYIAGNSSPNQDNRRDACLVSSHATSGATPFGYVFTISGNSSTTGTGIYFAALNSSVWTTADVIFPFSQNTWYHVAASKSSGTIRIFINGVSQNFNTNNLTSSITTSEPLRIGTNLYTNYNHDLNGYISNLRIIKGIALYTGNFTPSDTILSVTPDTSLLTCQGPTIRDVSVYNNTITANGNAVFSSLSPSFRNEFGKLTLSDIGSVFFDGTTDWLYAAVGSVPLGTGDFTIEGWFYWTNIANAGLFHVYPGTPLGTTNGTAVGFDGTQFQIYTGGTNNPQGGSVSVGTWYHVAYVKASNSVSLYINGVKQGVSRADTTNYLGNGLNIGLYYSSGFTFPGYISNVRVVAGTALYTSNFTPSTTPLTAIANTSLLTCQGPTLRDASTNNFTITRNGNAAYNDFSPFRPYLTENIDSGSIFFDGNADYLQLPSSGNLILGSGDLTIEAWIYLNSVSTWASVTGTLSFNAGASFRVTTTAMILDSSGINSVSRSTTISINTWHHVAVTRASNTVRFFLNGVQQGADQTSTLNFSGETRVIGGSVADNSGWLNGYIANLRIVKGTAVYTSNFTPNTNLENIPNTSLLLKFRSPWLWLKDESDNNFTVTTSGSPMYYNSSPEGNVATLSSSVYFDGNGDFLSIARNSAFLPVANEDFTIETWVYLTATPGAPVAVIAGLGEYGTDSDWNFQISSSLRVSFYINAIVTTFENTTTPITLNSWNHVAVSRSGTGSNNLKVFVNGIGQSFTTNSTTVGTGNRNLTIGADQNGDEANLTGYVSNFRIVKGTALYTANFIPPNQPLTAIANTQLLTCQGPIPTISDASSNNFTITKNGNAQWDGNNPFNIIKSSINQNGMIVKELDEVSMTVGSIQFDGVDDFITTVASATSDLGTISTSTNFTFDCWARWNVVNTSTYRIIATHAVAGSGGNGKGGWAISERSGILEFNISKTASTFNPWYVSFTTNQSVITTTATWHHIALVIASGVPKFYVNGVEAPSTFNTSAALYSSTLIGFDTTRTDYGVRVGASYTDSTNLNPVQFFSGYISNLRIVNGTAMYTSNFTPQQEVSDNVPNTSLLLNCLSGQEFTDSSPNNFTLTRNGLIASSTLNPISTTSTAQKLFYDGTIMVREFVES